MLDRFGQIAPKVLITATATAGQAHELVAKLADGYAGKRIELVAKLAELQPFLPSVTRCIVVDHLGGGEAAAAGLPVASPGSASPHPVGAPLV